MARCADSTRAPRQLPLEVATDTFVIRALMPSVGGTYTNLNSMVIRAAEPVVVDTGMVTDREIWFEDVFSLVRPEDLRWIFVTHNDTDHSGNLLEALARCPNAKVITSHGESFRTEASLGVPRERIRIVESDRDFSVGDRLLRPVRPPVYDSPYTRGVYDHATQVYYSSDAFCAPMPDGPIDRVDEIAPELWADGMARFHHTALCPWIALVPSQRLRVEVDKLAALDITTIVGAHTPVIAKHSIAQAFAQLVALPDAVPPPLVFEEPSGPDVP